MQVCQREESGSGPTGWKHRRRSVRFLSGAFKDVLEMELLHARTLILVDASILMDNNHVVVVHHVIYFHSFGMATSVLTLKYPRFTPSGKLYRKVKPLKMDQPPASWGVWYFHPQRLRHTGFLRSKKPVGGLNSLTSAAAWWQKTHFGWSFMKENAWNPSCNLAVGQTYRLPKNF